MEGEFLTNRGRVRQHNEDSGGIFYNRASQLLSIIADGMGGHQAGDVASHMAAEYFEKKWEKTTEFSSPDTIEKWLHQTLSEINHIIYQKSIDKEECKGMGTTVVISICTEEFVVIGHIGDSRCYLLNEEGFKSLTNDHSLVNELVRLGEISETEAKHHPKKNIVIKALGTEKVVTPDITIIEWETSNKLLLCSDGLTDKVFDDELEDYIRQPNPMHEIGQNLVSLANERGGEDNISLAIIEHNDTYELGDNSC